MTVKNIYEALLVEMNKVQAAPLLLEDFNYLLNKAIHLYTNKKYNLYDVNQQSTDDLRVLKATTFIKPFEDNNPMVPGTGDITSKLYGNIAKFKLPMDYYHLLNCVVIYDVQRRYKCYDEGDQWQTGAMRLTSDIWPQIINDFYRRPSYKNPYYFINNTNTSAELPTNPVKYNTDEYVGGTDVTTFLDSDLRNLTNKPENSAKDVNDKELPKKIRLGNSGFDDLTEKVGGHRYGNVSDVVLEVRYGKDDSIFRINCIQIDYLKAPQHVRFTQEQLDRVEDISQMMEFPDYVCQEIINELVHVVMENQANPRLQTHIPVSQSIAAPQGEPAQR